MVDLYAIFNKLQGTGDNKHFVTEEVSSTLPHRLGSSQELYPLFFVECIDEIPSANISLKQVHVNFNQVCNLRASDGHTITQKFTIILLKSQEEDLQKYFLELISLLLEKLPPRPTIASLKSELFKVISLFATPPAFSQEAIKGLWAELFVIARSHDPIYLINSWHISKEDKYDFNDGIDKVEVKATRNSDRTHTFSIEQLNPNADSRLIIASIITTPSGQGTNIFDLIDLISMNVTNIDALLKLKEQVYLTIGPNIDASKRVRFDMNMAISTYKLVYYSDIPTIPLSAIPSGVSDIHFKSCLRDTLAADLSSTSSQLHRAL